MKPRSSNTRRPQPVEIGSLAKVTVSPAFMSFGDLILSEYKDKGAITVVPIATKW